MDEFEQTFNDIAAMGGLGAPVVKSLIDEIVLEQLYQDRGLIAPTPPSIQKLLQNEDYIRGVLGIDIPLNESYPYSPALQERILQEQLLMEGWFDGFRKLAGDAKNMALALRYMFEDKSRIVTFVKQAYNNIIKEPLTKIVDFIKKIGVAISGLFEKFVMPKLQAVWDKVKGGLAKVSEMLESTWEKIKGMSGWKQALLVMSFGVGIGYMWKTKGWGEVIEKLSGYIDDITKVTKDYGAKLAGMIKRNKGPINLAKAGAKGAKKLSKKESAYASASLEAILLEDNEEALNEFLGKIFGKKNKEAEEMGLELPKGDPAPSDGILISPDQAKKAGIKGKSEKEAEAEKDDAGGGNEEGELEGSDEELNIIADLKEALLEYLQPVIDVLKEKVFGMAKEMTKSLGFDVLAGLATGGIATFIKGVQKVFGGLKMVSQLFGPTLAGFVKKIKNPEQEAKEAEEGKDDPTEAAWHDDEKLIREFVREKLLAAS